MVFCCFRCAAGVALHEWVGAIEFWLVVEGFEEEEFRVEEGLKQSFHFFVGWHVVWNVFTGGSLTNLLYIVDKIIVKKN
jgi:hypothetical protein